MKQFYLQTLLFSTTLFFTAHAIDKPVVDKDVLAQMQEHIAFSEYFIHWQNNTYQSPNRKNSLRTTYTGQELNISPSRNTAGQWSFSLAVKGVFADGRSLYKPVDQPFVVIDENKIQFNHDHQFTVEYVNNEQGIRQNFIIEQPAVHVTTLSIQLQPAEGWRTMQQSATDLSFKNKQQLLTYNDLKVWDAKGKKLAARFSVQHNQVEIEVDAENAIYPVTIDPIVANGIPQNANTFLQSNQAGAVMGFTVSGAGDINGDGYDDVILGAPGYSNGQTGEGAAFVYYGSSRGVNPTTYTLLENNIVNGQFGTVVTGGGDLDGDGYDDVVVSATYYSADSARDEGAIYAFYGSATGLRSTTPDILPGTYPRGSFGAAVSIAGDLNGDAYDDIVVGAGWATHGQANEGIVTIVYGGPWGILFTPNTVIEGNAPALGFGAVVAGAGDLNGDGYGDIAVEAYYGSTVYIYHGGFNGVAVTPAIILANGQPGSYLSFAIGGAGDTNGDGYDDLLIGHSDYNTYQGVAYLYNGSAAGISATPAITMVSPVDSASFGNSVANAGDINNDGFSDIIIGARAADTEIAQKGEGMAFVYYGRANGINPVPASTIQSNQHDALLGFSVASAGDVNGDGYSDVLIGAMTYTNGQMFEGAGFVYHGGAGSAGLLSAAPLADNLISNVPLATASIKTFPNPAVNNLSIQFEGLDAASSTSIQILNSQGSLIKTIQVGKVEKGNQPIDVSNLTPGLYFVIVQNGTKIFKEKIVKQ